MGKSTSIGLFLIFLLVQLVQGVLITIFLRLGLEDQNQWIWLAGDVLLLLFWLKMIHYRKRMIMRLDMPMVPLPTMTVAWGTYLAVVFVPRILWLMIGVETCLGKSDRIVNLTPFEQLILSELHNFTTIDLDANALTSTLSILSTVMLFCLVISGYGQHGLLKTFAPIDFDTAEAAFCVLDAIEFLGVFFDAPDVGRCGVTMEMENSTRPSVSPNTTQNLLNNSATEYVMENSTWPSVSSPTTVITTRYVPNNSDTEYVDALEGTLGKLILALVVVSYTVPFLALWQFHRQSNVVKVTTKVKGHVKRLRSLASQHSQSLDESSPSSPMPSTSFMTSSALSLKPSLTTTSSLLFSPNEVKTSPNDIADQYNNTVRVYEEDVLKTQRWDKELSALKLVYTILDIFVINLPAAAIRFLLWFQFKRAISALLAKNILAVLFRTVGLVNNYVIPCCNRSVLFKDAEDPANGITITPVKQDAATGNRALPKSLSLDVIPEQLQITEDAAESDDEDAAESDDEESTEPEHELDDPPVYYLTGGRRMSIESSM